ncbi:MAG: signal transduction protein [Piscirickettsiaceae bacterium]|nr:MAG: signal transduction protein [Piscirickettsiaceae bacterium]
MKKNTDIKQQHFLPDFCRADIVLYITLITQLLAIILALSTSYHTGGFWAALSFNALFILWVAFTSAAALCFFKQTINSWTPLTVSLFTFFIINFFTLITTWLVSFLLPELGLFPTFGSGHFSIYIKNLIVSSIIAIIVLRYLYIQYQWKKQATAQAEAKLDALQARIRPHFLFNSLNTIASLTREDPALAESLIEDLAELFRANMNSSQRLLPFEQECELTRQYLNIEQSRLGERLRIHWDVEAIPADAHIPPLSLQPLVENSVYHGIERSPEGGTLEILGSIRKNMITLIIRNPMSTSTSDNTREGNKIAVDNIRLRLQSCFPGQSKLLISVADGYFQTQIMFPYQTQ